jgi:hypothetical protein
MKYLLFLFLFVARLFSATQHICYEDSMQVHAFLVANSMNSVPVNTVALPNSFFTTCTKCGGWRIAKLYLSPGKVYASDGAIKALPAKLTNVDMHQIYVYCTFCWEIHLRNNSLTAMPDAWWEWPYATNGMYMDVRNNNLVDTTLLQGIGWIYTNHSFKIDVDSNNLCSSDSIVQQWLASCSRDPNWQATQLGCVSSNERPSKNTIQFFVGSNVQYTLQESGPVSILLSDILGKKTMLFDRYQQKGQYEISWQKPSTAGVYFIKYTAGKNSQVVKYVNVK